MIWVYAAVGTIIGAIAGVAAGRWARGQVRRYVLLGVLIPVAMVPLAYAAYTSRVTDIAGLPLGFAFGALVAVRHTYYSPYALGPIDPEAQSDDPA